MIGVVNYGLGNVNAFLNIYSDLNVPCKLISSSSDFDQVSHIILPGVGSFDWAMQCLDSSGLLPALNHAVIIDSTPILGVCVGMQIMANRSDEGQNSGLGWIKGDVKKMDTRSFTTPTRLPHMGWNDVVLTSHPLFENIILPRFYFLHSYSFLPVDHSNVLCTTTYGSQFNSGVYFNNIIGVQFHPEKSHHSGVQLLKNFSLL